MHLLMPQEVKVFHSNAGGSLLPSPEPGLTDVIVLSLQERHLLDLSSVGIGKSSDVEWLARLGTPQVL